MELITAEEDALLRQPLMEEEEEEDEVRRKHPDPPLKETEKTLLEARKRYKRLMTQGKLPP